MADLDLILTAASGSGGDADPTDHSGRHCLLLTRERDTSEMESLAEAVGLVIVETLVQSGRENVRSYLGSGRLDAIAAELASRNAAHPWMGVDLVLMHVNASPTQLVQLGSALDIECWDRVRLLLNLFTSKADSIDSRLQVRLAMLHADRSIMREVVRMRTKGEHLGHGAGGRHALESVMRTVDRELASLERKRRKRETSRRERRKRRARQGAKSIGLVGYTNAGKSSLFQMMAGKPVLIDDRLFSTLETAVGRLQASPRILMIDTIGFVDNLPSVLLDAFAATIDESAACELVLLVVDASDGPAEMERKLSTCLGELDAQREHLALERIQVVLSKADLVAERRLARYAEVIRRRGMGSPVSVSSVEGRGAAELREVIMSHLYGTPREVSILPPTTEHHRAVPAIIAGLHEIGHVLEQNEVGTEGGMCLTLWVDDSALSRMISRRNGQIMMNRGREGAFT